ncbi:MAG: hypothetical protein KA035_00440 [Candidatus Levybacteria bacterium]|nr:hypothetical protein [Candidatus Levybacteria bacterium]
MIGHEASFSVPADFRGQVDPVFMSEQKNAGWTKGIHGHSSRVVRHAIGRVAEGYAIDGDGNHALQVSEYYSFKRHDELLLLIPGEEVVGYTGQEIKVSIVMPVKEANKLKFSHSKIVTRAEEIPMGRIFAKAA